MIIIELLFIKQLFSENVSKDLHDENNTYLFTYSLIGMVNSVATFFRAFIFAYGGITACEKIHDKLLMSIMNVCIKI